MFDHYYIVDTGEGLCYQTSNWREKSDLLALLEYYPDSTVRVMSKQDHSVLYDWQPLCDILGRKKTVKAMPQTFGVAERVR